ncbi:MAG: HAMP domain-containing histidine kinase [Desulfobulbaceae bacterium]|nr:HAMP domain-containing histidine kinase [Desulfobulbaceae bacterium]
METTNADRICVQVFAKISAAISHEIKNTLSIINENAGLLEDFAQMTEDSGGVPPERVRSATGTMAKQVDRSNVIMKNLNRFAHSADTHMAHGNLEETLSLVIALTNRQAAMRNITTSLDCPPDITFSTYLFFLESLIYLTLLALFQNSPEGSELAIEVLDESPSINICFKFKNDDDIFLVDYPDNDQKLLAEQLDASCRYEKNIYSITFSAIVS